MCQFHEISSYTNTQTCQAGTINHGSELTFSTTHTYRIKMNRTLRPCAAFSSNLLFLFQVRKTVPVGEFRFSPGRFVLSARAGWDVAALQTSRHTHLQSQVTRSPPPHPHPHTPTFWPTRRVSPTCQHHYF